LFDFGYGGVLCTLSNTEYKQQQLGLAEARSWNSRLPGQALQYVIPGGMARLAYHSNVQTIVFPPLFSS
jgi:hypothetical protein